MKKIFLTGDSWFVGIHPDLKHKGLEQFLKIAGYQVINCSRAGCSNTHAADILSNNLSQYYTPGDLVFWVQTDPLRNLRTSSERRVATKNSTWFPTLSLLVQQHRGLKNLVNAQLELDYQKFNNIGREYNVTIGAIGGITSVNEELIKDIPFVNCVLRSWTELMLGHKVREDWANHMLLCSDWTINHIDVTGFNDPNLTALVINEIDKMSNSSAQIFGRPEFAPDGVHPGLNGHKQLFDYIVQKYNLKVGL